MRSLRWGVVLLLVTTAACSSGDDAGEPATADASTTVVPSTGATTEPTGPAITTVPATTAPTTEPTTTTTEPPATTIPATTTTPPANTTEPASTMVDVRVYFVRGERLEIAHRLVEAPAVLRGALGELLRGPTADERAAGLATAIPDGSALLDVALADGRAIVDLSRAFESGGGSLSMTARVAQVVFTATQFDNSDRVLFRLDGEPVDFLGGEGVPVAEPLARMDTERSLTGGVIVDMPEPGTTVRSPFVVTGEGDLYEGYSAMWVWRDGVEIAGPFGVNAGAWGTWDDFETTVTLDIAPGPIELRLSDGNGCTPGDPECGDPLLTIVPLILAD